MQPTHHADAASSRRSTRGNAVEARFRELAGRRASGLHPWGVLLAALSAATIAACGGDEPNGGDEPAVTVAEDADPQQLMTELRGIQQELGGIQQQALEDSALQSDRDSLERRLAAEIRALDPEAGAKQERAREIASEIRTAQQGGADEEARELAMENREIQASLQQTRQAALETQEMSAAVESFQQEMLAAMNEVDPRTDSLVARAEAIVAFLQERMAQQQAAPPAAPPPAAPDTAT